MLLGPLELRAECAPDRIRIPPGFLGREFAENHSAILPSLMQAAGVILVMAWAIVEDQLTDAQRQDPQVQFLRRVRQAIAHNGRFDFGGPTNPRKPRKSTPWKPAVWRQFALSQSMEGTRLFKDQDGDGLLSPGDPIWLLWDIEQKYPSLKA
jgi:hypothetical protein